MTKKELTSQLTNAKNNYVLGLTAISLFCNDQVYPILEQSRATFGAGYTLDFKQVKNLLTNHADRDIAVKEFLKSQIRALIKESFELVKDYCTQTSQNAAFRAQPWYHFARIIRNCLSHNFRIQFSRYDKSLLPLTWNGRTINASMDGQDLPLEFLSYAGSWELFMEFRIFSQNELS